FSRDRGMPGWSLFRRLNQARVPLYAVLAVSIAALLITIPAYWGTNGVPWAYFAITSICTVGLYLAYIIPVYLRLRQGDRVQPGRVTRGRWRGCGARARRRPRGREEMTEVIGPRVGGAVKGMLTVEELRSEVEKGTVDTVLTCFTDMQGRLMGKRVDGEYFLEDTVAHGSGGWNYLPDLAMEMDPGPGSSRAK